MADDALVVWPKPSGEPVACVEKIKVLNENMAEFRALVREFLEDAVLMGCDGSKVRAVLKDEIDSMQIEYSEIEESGN